MNDSRWSRRDFALLLLLAGLVALFFWRILTPNPADRAQFPAGDFTDQFYAFRLYEARALTEGRIPLWSENFNSGHPFLADIQSGVFYPIGLANTLLNLALFKAFSLFALELEAVFHFWLAGAFTYLFARRTLWRAFGATARVGAFTSALVFTFGGYLTSYPSLQLAILETAVWLPPALWCIDKATADGGRRTDCPSFVIGRWRWFIAAGIVLGIAALAGHPQTLLFVVAMCAIYFSFRAVQTHSIRDARFAMRVAAQIALLLVIAFGIAAVQFVPAIEYQQLSTREALSFADAAKGFPTLDLVQFILPGAVSAFASPLYVGILPLWLAIFAPRQRRRTDDEGQRRNDERRTTDDGRRTDVYFWGLLALGALILSFGFYVFAYVVFYLFVPGASLFRQQERLAFIVSFALAMLAGYGIAALGEDFDRKRAEKLFALLPFGAALMLALMLAFFVAGAGNPEGRISFLGDRAGLMLLQFGLASLLLGLYLRKTISVKWFAPLAIVLILFDLWSVNEPANKGRVEDRFADIPFAEQIKSDSEIFRVAADEQLLPGHFGIGTGMEDLGGISPLRLARYDALLKLPPPIYLPLLNVKYVITRDDTLANADMIAREGDVQLLRLQNEQPRAWLVGNVSVEADDARAMERAREMDFRSDAILASTPTQTFDARAQEGRVNILARGAEKMSLEVNTPADGLLVLSENYYPGWRATVDKEPVEILRADVTLRAIPVRAGQHRIEIWYEPLSFKIGAGISGVTILLCVGALVIGGMRANRIRNNGNAKSPYGD